MRQDSPLPRAMVLNSWKEIALYVGRGVRTVQRWERDLGLPVHRPRGKQRSAVLAIPEELDYWIQNTPGRGLGEVLLLRGNGAPPHPLLPQAEARRAQALRSQSRDLRARSVILIRQIMESTCKQREGALRLRQKIRCMTAPAPERTERASAS